MPAATLDDILYSLNTISTQLNIAVGVRSQYSSDIEEQKKNKEEAVKPTLTADEKTRYKNIAHQFKSVLGITALKETLDSLKTTLTDQQKATKEAERASHIARYTTRSTGLGAKEVRDTASKENLSFWLKTIGAGSLLSLLGGLGAVTTSMLKVGPLYGILQNITKYTSLASLKATIFATGKFLKLLLLPFELISKFTTGKSMERLMERGALKLLGKDTFKQTSKLLSFAGKGLKFLKPVPLLGSVISFYFAWDRFRKGDITGGLLEVGSGIASLVPGVGTAISIGLDMINLYRDLSGKSEAETKIQSPTKTWLKDRMNKLGEYIEKNCYDWPVIGSLIRTYEHFTAGNWPAGINSLAHSIPIVGTIVDFFVKETDSRTGKTYKHTTLADTIKKLWNENVDEFSKKMPIVGNLIKAIRHFKKGEFSEGFEVLKTIIPGVDDVVNFITTSSTPLLIKDLIPNVGGNIKSFTDWALEKTGLGTFFKDLDKAFSEKEDRDAVITFIKDKIHTVLGKMKDYFVGFVSGVGNVIGNMMTPSSDMSMQFINVVTKIKPAIDKMSKELQITFSSSLKEQLSVLSQIEAVLYMQKDILEDNRSLLREIANNTKTTSPLVVNGSYNEPSIMREERSFTRRSYINDVRSMNAVVRESLA